MGGKWETMDSLEAVDGAVGRALCTIIRIWVLFPDKVINICNPTALTVRWKVETGDPWKLTDQIVWCPSE